MAYYTQPLNQNPENMREGLLNFLQMIINCLEDGDNKEALLKAVDLRQDVDSGIYDNLAAKTTGQKSLHGTHSGITEENFDDFQAFTR